MEHGEPDKIAQQACRRNTRHANVIIFSLAAFMVIAMFVSLMLGRYPINPSEGFWHVAGPDSAY